MTNQLMSIREAGQCLGYTGKSSGKTTIYKHCNEGRLVKVKIGGRSFVTTQSVAYLICTSTVTPTGRALAECDEDDSTLDEAEAEAAQ